MKDTAREIAHREVGWDWWDSDFDDRAGLELTIFGETVKKRINKNGSTKVGREWEITCQCIRRALQRLIEERDAEHEAEKRELRDEIAYLKDEIFERCV